MPAIVLAAVLALTGCSSGEEVSSPSALSACLQESCTVELSGVGAQTQTLDGQVPVRFDSSADGVAQLTIGGESISCRQGDSQTVAGYLVYCEQVRSQSLWLEISRI